MRYTLALAYGNELYARLSWAILDKSKKQKLIKKAVSEPSVRNVKQHNNTQGLESYTTTQLKAELESRKSATHVDGDVYERAGVSEGNEQMFDDVVYAICEEDLSITEVSTPGRAGYITGNAKNWVRNLGGISAFKEMHSARGWEHTWPSIEIPMPVQNMEIPTFVSDYFTERGKTTSAFRTQVFLVETGSHDGKPFGVVVKPNGTRYVVGKLKQDKVQAFKDTTPVYKSVDKATKGQRMKVEILVFDPVG